MDRIALPIGSADFKDIRTSGDYYVDKTAAISQLVHDSSRAIQFTRPPEQFNSHVRGVLERPHSSPCSDIFLISGRRVKGFSKD